jgi:bla regulator protein BlaR1
MTIYLFKSILCLAILLLVYLLFLEKEKMHRFNRWYLLGSIVFACLVPLISFKISSESAPILPDTYFTIIDQTSSNNNNTQAAAAITQTETVNYLIPSLLIVYGLIVLILLIRFIRNIYLLISNATKNKKLTYRGANLVLLKEKVASHSFLNYIFISEEDYSNQAIEEELITHELTHVREKHSWDVIFIELLQIFFWFNPLFIFYKKAIQLNHEYLADDAVIKTYQNVPAYQYLLLEKVSLGSKTYLTSNFNYSVTKKRLVMMTRKFNPARTMLKKLLVLPALAVATFIFSSRIKAQNPPIVTTPSKAREVASTKDGVSQQLLNEFEAIIKKNMIKTKTRHDILANVMGTDRDRLESIFLQMSKAQQAEAKAVFEKRTPLTVKGKPTATQFESFKDPVKFGVWIDGKKVNNEVLNKYSADDFGNYHVSNLYYTDKMKADVMRDFNLTTMYEKQLDLTTKAIADQTMKNELATMKSRPNMLFYRIQKGIMVYIN